VIGRASSRFWKAFEHLPSSVKDKAREAHRLWLVDPRHSSLQFKKVHERYNIFSVRVGLGWRAVCVREDAAAFHGGVRPYLCSSVSGKSLTSHKTRARSCLKNLTPEFTVYGIFDHFGGDRISCGHTPAGFPQHIGETAAGGTVLGILQGLDALLE